jgi:CheY-like chemotaxis protein
MVVEPLTKSPRSRPDGRRILVVDDHVDAAETLAELLELLGHETRVAFDARSALEIVRTFHPDVALLDIGLPVMDGCELARRLRQLPALEKTRLIALTGYGRPSDRAVSAAAGFDAHLLKPIEISQLEALIAGGDGSP